MHFFSPTILFCQMFYFLLQSSGVLHSFFRFLSYEPTPTSYPLLENCCNFCCGKSSISGGNNQDHWLAPPSGPLWSTSAHSAQQLEPLQVGKYKILHQKSWNNPVILMHTIVRTTLQQVGKYIILQYTHFTISGTSLGKEIQNPTVHFTVLPVLTYLDLYI